MFKSLKGISYSGYFGDTLNALSSEQVSRQFDEARLSAESGMERMFEIVEKRGSSLNWKVKLMQKALKTAFTLVSRL